MSLKYVYCNLIQIRDNLGLMGGTLNREHAGHAFNPIDPFMSEESLPDQTDEDETGKGFIHHILK